MMMKYDWLNKQGFWSFDNIAIRAQSNIIILILFLKLGYDPNIITLGQFFNGPWSINPKRRPPEASKAKDSSPDHMWASIALIGHSILLMHVWCVMHPPSTIRIGVSVPKPLWPGSPTVQLCLRSSFVIVFFLLVIVDVVDSWCVHLSLADHYSSLYQWSKW